MQTYFSALVSPFHSLVFAQFQANAEGAKAGFYPDVLIIEEGPAKGHYAVKGDDGRVVNFDRSNPDHAKLQKYPIVIGSATLDDVVRCGNSEDWAKCKLDHGSTVRDIVGKYVTFRRDGTKVRANLTLLENSPHRSYVEEIISQMSKKIGNSIDFDYLYEIQDGKAVARCVKLNSVDIVDTPAATNSLFTEQTNNEAHMPLTKEDLEAIGSVVDTKLSALKAETDKQFSAIKTQLEADEESDEDKKKREDKEKKDKEDGTELSTMIKTATLAAVREVLPKATLENLASLSKGAATPDAYEEKIQLCAAAGITGPAALRHIARQFPAIYTAKFGNGGGGKGSATTTQL